jgi:SPX domain protein involved in polyphosphate accumulation
LKSENVIQQEPLRYERKFLITDYSYKDMEQMIKFHPACFSEIYHERIVNNIYFDSPGLMHYFDNVEGSPERLKVRIRWYGDIFGKINKPVLEFKIKKGLLGRKESYVLGAFTLNVEFNMQEIENALNFEGVPTHIKNEVLSLKPTLLNSYTRRYYLSADKNYRITVDHHLTYYGISLHGNNFTNKSLDLNSTVMELKYNSNLEDEAKFVANQFSFPLTKSSKYLQGLERVFI